MTGGRAAWTVALQAAALATGLLLGPGAAEVAAQTPAPGCQALAQTDLARIPDAPSRVLAAKARGAGEGKAAACIVDGYANPTIGWRIWLPEPGQWNGKLGQDGCGGRCGARKDEACEMMAARGYACVAPDLGYAGANQDWVWAIDNVAGEIDVAFRAAHVVNRVAREVVRRYYGAAPRKVYYLGISNAGRQGLLAAQRFPQDFDGIVAGEPPMRSAALKDLPSTMQWASGLLSPGGKAAFDPAALKALHDAILARCDRDDNLADGLIADPRACRFDPATIQCQAAQTDACLSAAQVDIVRKLYAGQATAVQGQIGLRFMPGSELRWIGPYLSADGGAGRYKAAKPDDGYDYPYGYILNDSSNPDLRAFKAAGGKLIMFHGWSDEIALPEVSVDYYTSVERLMGGARETRDFARLFMIPGQGHTAGGPGAEAVDYLSYLEAWVERCEAPDALKAHHLKDGQRFFGALIPPEDLRPDNVAFTRPLYPYPARARYAGRGDPDDWKNFKPVAP